MTKCKKIGFLAGFIIMVVVLIGLITPYFLGIAAEKSIKKVVAGLPQEQGVTIDVKSYHRGWFGAKAIIQVALDPSTLQSQGKMPPKLYLNITENIAHGPFIFIKDFNNKYHFRIGRALAVGQIVIPNAERQLMIKRFTVDAANNQNAILITLLGNIKVSTQLPKLVIESVDGAKKLMVSNFDVNYKVSPDYKRQAGRLALDELTYVDGTQVLKVKNVNHRFDLSRKMSHLWAGKSKLNVADILLTDNSKVVFEQKSIAVNSNAKVDKKLLDLEINADTGALTFEDKKLGPGAFMLQLNNFGAKAVNQLRVLNEQLENQKLGTTQYLQAFYHLAPKLLGYGAQIHLSPCELDTPYGKLSLGLNATFPNIQKDKITDNRVMFKNVESMNQVVIPQKLLSIILTKYYQNRLTSMMQLADAQSKAEMTPDTMSKLVDSKVKATIANWQQQNYLVAKNSNFELNLDYKQGQLNVNGKAVN